MAELPCCRLCKCNAEADRVFPLLYNCSNYNCHLAVVRLTEAQWRKLMYVPKKITPREPFEAFDLGYERGYNNAIDDMLRGGE